jgi:hypothetical protein
MPVITLVVIAICAARTIAQELPDCKGDARFPERFRKSFFLNGSYEPALGFGGQQFTSSNYSVTANGMVLYGSALNGDRAPSVGVISYICMLSYEIDPVDTNLIAIRGAGPTNRLTLCLRLRFKETTVNSSIYGVDFSIQPQYDDFPVCDTGGHHPPVTPLGDISNIINSTDPFYCPSLGVIPPELIQNAVNTTCNVYFLLSDSYDVRCAQNFYEGGWKQVCGDAFTVGAHRSVCHFSALYSDGFLCRRILTGKWAQSLVHLESRSYRPAFQGCRAQKSSGRCVDCVEFLVMSTSVETYIIERER